MDNPSELRELIDKLQSTINQIYALDSGWKARGAWPKDVTGAILHPPATEEQIARVEEQRDLVFPPSYRDFLLLHSGWEHFFWDFTLVGVDDDETPAASAKITEYINYQREESLPGTIDDFSAPAIANWESKHPKNLYLANHLVIGTDFRGALWVYDTRTRRVDGEMTLVFWTLDYGAWENEDRRFQTFHDFLRWAQTEADSTLSWLNSKQRSTRPSKENSSGAGGKKKTSKGNAADSKQQKNKKKRGPSS